MAKGFSIELETAPLPLPIWQRAACPTGKKISFCPGSGTHGDTHEVSLHPEVILQKSNPTLRSGRCSVSDTGTSLMPKIGRATCRERERIKEGNRSREREKEKKKEKATDEKRRG